MLRDGTLRLGRGLRKYPKTRPPPPKGGSEKVAAGIRVGAHVATLENEVGGWLAPAPFSLIRYRQMSSFIPIGENDAIDLLLSRHSRRDAFHWIGCPSHAPDCVSSQHGRSPTNHPPRSAMPRAQMRSVLCLASALPCFASASSFLRTALERLGT
jgi:hypothetical protein